MDHLSPSHGPNPPANTHRTVWFHRLELSTILTVYGGMVSRGEWRDYAINALRDRAVFSIYQRTTETPLYTIEKRPDLARKQGAFAVRGSAGQILKRGHDLRSVLRVFDRKKFSVIDD